jgi:hypothetical protein
MAGLGDYGSCDAWASETEGDVLLAHLIAPYAKIVISVTPAGSQDDAASQIAMPEMMKALEVISSQHLANVISISNGTGEATYPNLAEILANNPGFDVATGWGTVHAPKFVPSLVHATAELGGEAAIKAQATAQLNALEHHAITLTPAPGHSTYLEAGGFLPGHTVTLTIDGKAITTLHASTLGNVTYMISPSLLHLSGGSHALSLGSLLITETASFSS